MTTGYLEHLTAHDLGFLAKVGDRGASVDDGLGRLRTEPGLVERVLADQRVYEQLFGDQAKEDPLLVASPFLIFAVIVQRAARELQRTSFVREWVGPRRRLPVFDVSSLNEFLAEPAHRLFLIELLASYARVASGSVWVKTTKGWRRQRFSELDPVRFASLLDVVPENERPGIYRRLGDLCLFLTGVFPDRGAGRPFGRLTEERLLHAAMTGRTSPQTTSLGARTPMALLEDLGPRWYKLAYAEASPRTAAMKVVESVAERFREARRVLNFATDRFLFPHRTRWFSAS